MGDWADELLAGSNLPDDEFTFTEGSNYGLDSFEFDEEENEGVLDGARLPETKGLAVLPGDLIIDAADDFDEGDIVFDEEDEDGLNLGDYVDETAIEPTASLSDLGWLDPTSPQNPDRLPESPVDKGILKLEEAWGLDRRTDGINLVPNKDKEVLEYEHSLNEGPQSGLPEGDREAIKTAIQWAFRAATDGVSLDEIKRGLIGKLSRKAQFTRGAVEKIETDEGLLGNVFVYSSVYPDIHKAKFAKRIKQHLRKKGARYVVVPPGEQRLAVWGSIGLKPVSEVPWKAAYRQYRPGLVAAGHKVATKGNPREVLKRAFLGGPAAPEHVPSPKPVDVRPSERVGVQEALHQFRTAEAVPVQALDNTSRIEEAQRKKVLVQVAKWVKAGHLSVKDAHRLARSSVSPEMILRTATLMTQAAMSASSTYEGGGTQFDVGTPTTKCSSQGIKGKEARSLMKWAQSRIEEGSKESEEDTLMRLRAAMETQAEPSDGSIYEGDGVQFDVGTPTTEFGSRGSGVKKKDINALLKWARIQMSEGTAGVELDTLMKLRFSKPLLKAAKKRVGKLRDMHEGLSGHVYVDAKAYASKNGTKGCEKGARTHRTGGLKAVLAMSRCETCTLKNADEVCSLYNKPLVDSPPVADPGDYQRAAIKASNASDAEVTASLFANEFDEGEYSLTDPLQEIGFDEAASPEELGEILFGDGLQL